MQPTGAGLALPPAAIGGAGPSGAPPPTAPSLNTMQQQLAAHAKAGGAPPAKPQAPKAPGGKGGKAGEPAAPSAADGQQAKRDADAKKAAAASRKRKAGEMKALGKGAMIPESPLFSELQESERRVDALISRKRAELAEMQASFRGGAPGTPSAAGAARKKLRVYIYLEHSHQGARQGEGTDPPSWALHICGRLVDASEPPGAAQPHAKQRHLSSCVRHLTVQLDPEQYPGPGGRAEWKREAALPQARDGFELRRQGAAPCEAAIALELDHRPQLYRLSPELAALLGLRGLHSLPFVMQALWAYCKRHRLHDAATEVRCDERTAPLFGPGPVEFKEMQRRVRELLTLPEPVTIKYTIRPDGPSPSVPECYDFDFDVPLAEAPPAFVGGATAAGKTAEREIDQVDSQLATTLHRLGEHRRRRTFLLALARGPAEFVSTLAATQALELRVASSREGESLEILPPGDVFSEKWVEDAVLRYMNRKAATATAAAARQHAAAAAMHAGLATQAQTAARGPAAARPPEVATQAGWLVGAVAPGRMPVPVPLVSPAASPGLSTVAGQPQQQIL